MGLAVMAVRELRKAARGSIRTHLGNECQLFSLLFGSWSGSLAGPALETLLWGLIKAVKKQGGGAVKTREGGGGGRGYRVRVGGVVTTQIQTQ